MSKPIAVVSCPIDTYSGYGARSRDFVKALIDLDQFDVKILSQRWGNTRFGYLEDHSEDDLASRIIPSLTSQPEVWIQITVPNEFQNVGKYNIGVTAGMETTIVHHTWITGCNKMDLNLVSSEHSKKVFLNTTFDTQDKTTGVVTGKVAIEKPMEVLLEGADLTKYFPTNTSSLDLSAIEENFCYLVMGHWMQGDFGQDRKNIGYTIKAFLEAFKNKANPPALVLKTMQVSSSIMDREKILDKIQEIRSTVRGALPNIYLLHGEVNDQEVRELYNHPKIKVMLSLTKGEGFGRPLLEFSLIGKPIIASGWSGQIDFLDPANCILVGGKLENVHKSAVQKDMILAESQWFTPDDIEVGRALKETFKNYKKYIPLAKKLKFRNKSEFSYNKMVEVLGNIVTKNVPEFPKEVKLTLPKLELPKLEKIN